MMPIAKNTVVTIDYTPIDDLGSVLDTSKGGEPLLYVQGIGNLIPGLEKALEGKQPGDHIQVTVPPEEAYGERDDDNLQVVSRSLFEDSTGLEVGMQVQAQSDSGTQVLTVTALDEDSVTLDGNHPLAGEALNFDVRVVDVRDATAEELEHGHAHSGGHGH
jgi:FKBP-type peptidyl-prolyl cis-trans isomerase SlyD